MLRSRPWRSLDVRHGFVATTDKAIAGHALTIGDGLIETGCVYQAVLEHLGRLQGVKPGSEAP